MEFHSILNREYEELRGQIVSVIGGGGKSSLIYKMARELVEKGLKVIITTTTKIQYLENIAIVLRHENRNFKNELSTILGETGVALVAYEFYKKEKLIGINKHLVPELKRYADIVLTESDGCRQRPLKTHKSYEPVIPLTTNTVVIICGSDAVGRELHDSIVHRADLFSLKWGLPFGSILTPEIIANELLSPYGYLRNIPLRSNVCIFINKSDVNESGGRQLAEQLTKRASYPVFLGSIKNETLAQVTTELSEE